MQDTRLVRIVRPLCAMVLAGCLVGPAYHVPPAPVPTAATYKGAGGWAVASPADAIPRGRWWTMYRDADLDALERRLDVDNPTIAQALASYEGALAQVRGAAAQYYPTVTLAPSALALRTSSSGAAAALSAGAPVPTGGGRTALYVLPLDVSWQPDLFGRVRYAVRQRAYAAQVSAAELESTRLLLQSLLAQTYFQLRGQDVLLGLLDDTIAADLEIAELTRARLSVGLVQEVAVVQAELTLELARVQAANAAVARATLENAIASLVGAAATDFTIPRRAHLATAPAIPLGTPSQLLERRPDIAAAERAVAAANAGIGLARTAYFPLVQLVGSECSTAVTGAGACAGFVSSTLKNLLTWPSRAWAIGANVAETLFDGGRRRADVDLARAQYRETVAAYRRTVLGAFQEVEDGLARARGFAREVELQRRAVALAARALELERARFEKGLDPYIDLALQQTALLSAQQTLVALQVQQVAATVALIQALGGGWTR